MSALKKLLPSLSGRSPFACRALVLAGLLASAPGSGLAHAQSATSGGPPVQVTALKQNRSGDSSMQIERGMVVTQVINASPRQMIEAAYGVREDRIAGGPTWAAAQHYDLTYSGGALSSEGTTTALKQVLTERFHLVLRQQNKVSPVYALTVAKGGPKLRDSTLPENPDTGQAEAVSRLNVTEQGGEITLTGHIGALVDALISELDRPVVDRTGLPGIYAVHLHWNAARTTAKSLTMELQQQLGLTLVPQQAVLPYCVILRIDLPAEM